MPPETNIPNNSEIDKALKEFEMKAQAEQVQKVAETTQNSDVPKMDQFLIKYSGGLIKNQQIAEKVLLIFVILAISISLYLFFGSASPAPKISPLMMQEMKRLSSHPS